MSDWTGWIELCLESALLALAFVLIYEGARRLVVDGPSRWIALMLLVGLAAPVYEGLASLRLSRTLQVLARQPDSMLATEPAGGWEKAPLSAEDRSRASTHAAALNFRLTGKRGTLVTPEGNRVPYQPTDEDLSDRDSLVHGQKGTEDASVQFFERGVRLLSVSAVLMLIGAATGLRQRRGPTAARRTASPAGR